LYPLSSPANIAAYINTLTYNLEDSGKISKNPWKITHATFCCFNAFSRVDVRIEVKIPGTVEAYIVDLKGDRQVISGDKIWQELFLSSLLRAILDDSDEPDSTEAGFVVG
jgi:Chs5-Arf1p-binding protein BUD7/BCH1